MGCPAYDYGLKLVRKIGSRDRFVAAPQGENLSLTPVSQALQRFLTGFYVSSPAFLLQRCSS
jgi:hypothetical protein